jgi:phosphoglycerate dehydrogenase-like enzyme
VTRVLFCGSGWFGIVERVGARLPDGDSIVVRDQGRPIAAQVEGVTLIIPSDGRIDEDVFEAATSLELVQQTATGTEGIDLDAAKRRGIPVCNAPGKNAAAVAETALFLILALVKRLPRARRAFGEGIVGEPAGRELEGKTLGIVGLGASGSRLARAAESLGMRVVSVGSKASEADRARLFEESDVLSLHCPLTDETRGLVDEVALSRMKKGALLVNCARGPVVDRDALVAALEAGRLGGVGLDVHWREPADPKDPLYARDDVVALPHVAGSTEESFDRLVGVLFENLRRLRAGEPLLHRVA